MSYGVTVGQQAYEKVKAMLRAGQWRPGTQLDIGTLASMTNVSATPMREALHRLAAERLIDGRTGQGFFVPRPTEAELRSLYRWWGRLARAAIDVGRHRLPLTLPAEGVFLALANLAREPELAAALASAEDRLSPFRAIEAKVLADPPPDFAAHAAAGDARALRRAVARYSALRLAAVGDLLELALAADDIG